MCPYNRFKEPAKANGWNDQQMAVIYLDCILDERKEYLPNDSSVRLREKLLDIIILLDRSVKPLEN